MSTGSRDALSELSENSCLVNMFFFHHLAIFAQSLFQSRYFLKKHIKHTEQKANHVVGLCIEGVQNSENVLCN